MVIDADGVGMGSPWRDVMVANASGVGMGGPWRNVITPFCYDA